MILGCFLVLYLFNGVSRQVLPVARGAGPACRGRGCAALAPPALAAAAGWQLSAAASAAARDGRWRKRHRR